MSGKTKERRAGSVEQREQLGDKASYYRQSRPRKSAQDDKWSFCLTAGTLCPANQERR